MTEDLNWSVINILLLLLVYLLSGDSTKKNAAAPIRKVGIDIEKEGQIFRSVSNEIA